MSYLQPEARKGWRLQVAVRERLWNQAAKGKLLSFAKTRYGQEKRLRLTVKRGYGLPNSPPFRVQVVDWTVVE